MGGADDGISRKQYFKKEKPQKTFDVIRFCVLIQHPPVDITDDCVF